ncbi:dTDP-4-dehydrorhamnose reductase [Planctomicrobium sp. SH664]|uniref:dTDP-4-dehydrorhamnose reductase n=1 Tax=Planctomicrobium sp. SH664 TaxID=3448125 RepID=UPI003F5C6998
MRIALIGAAGQLGTDLAAVLDEVVPLTHEQIDITDPASLSQTLSAIRPALVINTAAYNLVDQAEVEPEQALLVNATGPRLLAEWCQSHAAALLHVSTDYVFGGDRERSIPYRETDEPAPLGVYGRSKLSGEEAVRSHCERHFIVRTCGLYGRAATRSKGNFVKTMLRLAGERPELKVVNDQHCVPTYTADLARAIQALIRTEAYGLYHATNSGSTTWYDVAREALRLSGLPTRVNPIPSAAYPTKAERPGYSVLNCEQLAAVTGHVLPPWQDALRRYLEQEAAAL